METRTKFSIIYFLIVFLGLFALQYYLTTTSQADISYKTFRELVSLNAVKAVSIGEHTIHGLLRTRSELDSLGVDTTAAAYARLKKIYRRFGAERPVRFRTVRVEDRDLLTLLETHQVDYSGAVESNWVENFLLYWILPFLFLAMLWGFLLRRIGPGNPVLSFGRSRAKIFAADMKNRVTFKDVAGIDEAVEEVREIVDFLKNPQKYQRLGGKMPKGVLLVGPPGTGKTLLAKAVAGEAGVPFFSITGSEFVEMFVGVGAARVRDLFAQAKERAPCIVFIDEIDAIGRSRVSGPVMGGHDERENTLNQLLSEMDGFDSSAGVVIMAATNRPEVLDPALLRPGRFDRQIVVDRPDLNGRVAIFKVHMRHLPLADDVDVHLLAAQTPGFAGAEIANVCNEAALLAARKGRSKIHMSDFEEAIERVVAGLEKRTKVINPREREIVAYHESGHALVGYYLPHGEYVAKVSIVPRGIGALGYTLQTPLEDRYLLTREELLDRITSLLGGRAAEEIVFGTISTGAANDIEKATQIVRNMILVYGMSERLPNVSFADTRKNQFLGAPELQKPFSEKTAEWVDQETRQILDNCYQRARNLLLEHRDRLDALARRLLEKEVVERKELEEILGKVGEMEGAQQ
ncbi:MAG: ATP-dependent metallopeptidase FtsH/Yme1/Tma family protein [Calditrichaeota bacterium]|nr:MAG: ATP-dependent metallopeptidase FtsH/Yme1/Tma family protein [Calditrichota bacterium]